MLGTLGTGLTEGYIKLFISSKLSIRQTMLPSVPHGPKLTSLWLLHWTNSVGCSKGRNIFKITATACTWFYMFYMSVLNAVDQFEMKHPRAEGGRWEAGLHCNHWRAIWRLVLTARSIIVGSHLTSLKQETGLHVSSTTTGRVWCKLSRSIGIFISLLTHFRQSDTTRHQGSGSLNQKTAKWSRGLRYTRQITTFSKKLTVWIGRGSELRSCVKVEVAVPGSPSLLILLDSLDVKQHWAWTCVRRRWKITGLFPSASLLLIILYWRPWVYISFSGPVRTSPWYYLCGWQGITAYPLRTDQWSLTNAGMLSEGGNTSNGL